MSEPEKERIVGAYSFELGKCDMSIREMNIEVLANVDLHLAQQVAKNIGITPPEQGGSDVTKSSPELSQQNTVKSPHTRKVGVLLNPGFKSNDVNKVLEAFKSKGVNYEIVSENQDMLKGDNGTELKVDHTYMTTDGILHDAIYAVGGSDISSKSAKEAAKFIAEAFDHYKTIGAADEGKKWLEAAEMLDAPGIITDNTVEDFAKQFIAAIAEYRHWERKTS